MSTSKKHALSDDESIAERTPIKHHLTPLELQKKQLDKLLEKIDKPVRIPERPTAKPINREPKDYVKNIQGSSAGAGSGDFHVYRAGRRREYARLKQMDEESKEVSRSRCFVVVSRKILLASGINFEVSRQIHILAVSRSYAQDQSKETLGIQMGYPIKQNNWRYWPFCYAILR